MRAAEVPKESSPIASCLDWDEIEGSKSMSRLEVAAALAVDTNTSHTLVYYMDVLMPLLSPKPLQHSET